ncbi:hypothetical protein JCM8097_005987 [Rhodosporidiobolus ruineniae]
MFAWYALGWLVWSVFTSPPTIDSLKSRPADRFFDSILAQLLSMSNALVGLYSSAMDLGLLRYPVHPLIWRLFRVTFALLNLVACLAPGYSARIMYLLLNHVLLPPLIHVAPVATATMQAGAYVFVLWAYLAVWYLLITMMGPFIVVGLFGIGLFELVFYPSTLVLFAAVWTTVYGEVVRAIWLRRVSRSVQSRNGALSLLRLAQLEADATASFCRLQSTLEASTSQLQPSPILPSLSQLDTPWIALIKMDEAFLSTYAYHHRKLCGTEPTWGDLEPDLLSAAYQGLTSALDAELGQRAPSLTIHPRNFRHRTSELAGMVIRYLLPLPAGLEHLQRPFRFRALLPFFVTYPIFLRLPMSYPDQHQPPHIPEAAWPFGTALYSVLLSFQNSAPDLHKKALKKLLFAHLSMVSARYRLVKAEEKAHEAILDAVLDWKTAREDERRAREKLKVD